VKMVFSGAAYTRGLIFSLFFPSQKPGAAYTRVRLIRGTIR